MAAMSEDEERVWKYILATKQFDPAIVSLKCNVDVDFAQSCIDRISTPLNIFKEEPLESAVRKPRVSVDPTRVRMLERAKTLTGGDRNRSYGPPFDNLTDCANLINAYINSKRACIKATADGYEVDLKAEDVAWIMVLIKAGRSFQPGIHEDNYVDAAAYAAIAGECREIQIEEDGQ